MEISEIFLLMLVFGNSAGNLQCYEGLPEKMDKSISTAGIDNYQITIEGNPERYLPGESYTVNLKAKQTNVFTEFILVVEPSKGSSAGTFFLLDSWLTRFSTKCKNTLIHVNTIGKTRINVTWVAPPEGSGCVVFRGTVLEASDNWYADGEGLSKEFCEESTANPDVQSPYLDRCCACTEAKYEMAFQGLWSRNTHPIDFPSNHFDTKFGAIIGASHKIKSAFWEYDKVSSEAMQLYAETGDTSMLESDLKAMVKNGDIRTIIKARELSHPNRMGTSYTNFRVDKNSHVISVVSKITPSPDWIVGVSNFELCTADCSWIKNGVLNLYPWDLGTDDGNTYLSHQHAFDPKPIRRIFSNDSSTIPFYNPEEDIKPLAKLVLTRQKVYEKPCEEEEEGTEDPQIVTEIAPEEKIEDAEPSPLQRKFRADNLLLQEPDGPVVNCEVTRWSQWTKCNATRPCTKGYIIRTRQIIQHAENGGRPCPQRIFKKRKCFAPCYKNKNRM